MPRGLSRLEVAQRREAPMRHGAASEVQIVRRATVEKRRLLRQIGLAQKDLESLGRALLTNWARAAAALSLLDEYAQREGWLDDDGNQRGFTRLYVSLLNSERLALKALGEYLRSQHRDDVGELIRKYGGDRA